MLTELPFSALLAQLAETQWTNIRVASAIMMSANYTYRTKQFSHSILCTSNNIIFSKQFDYPDSEERQSEMRKREKL